VQTLDIALNSGDQESAVQPMEGSALKQRFTATAVGTALSLSR
jgi:hypothetical protein